jgi:biofilm protein TabA
MCKDWMVRNAWVALAVCVPMVSLTGCSANKEAAGPMKRDHMIVDRLANAKKYYDMHPAFEEAFAFLRRSDLADLPEGRHEIDGSRLFCLISNGPGRSRAEAKLEAHRKYIDIQYVMAGADEMGWKPTAACVMSDVSYDPEKDIEFFKDVPDRWTPVPTGSFAIFFPIDAHAPLVSTGRIHKAVLKIAVE